MVIRLALCPFFLAMALSVGARGLPDKHEQPIVSGTRQGNVGCVILEKHMPVKGKLLPLGVVYARTEYRVVQSFNHSMPKQKYTGQDEIEELNQLAVKDNIKLVVIPSHYTDEQLKKARKVCQGESAAAAARPSPATTK